MAVKKKPDMSPIVKKKGSLNTSLMDNLDTENKGDSVKVTKVPTTILLPANLKEEAQEYARNNDTKLTTLIIEGLRQRMGKDY